jgi:hypothetical protein
MDVGQRVQVLNSDGTNRAAVVNVGYTGHRACVNGNCLRRVCIDAQLLDGGSCYACAKSSNGRGDVQSVSASAATVQNVARSQCL